MTELEKNNNSIAGLSFSQIIKSEANDDTSKETQDLKNQDQDFEKEIERQLKRNKLFLKEERERSKLVEGADGDPTDDIGNNEDMDEEKKESHTNLPCFIAKILRENGKLPFETIQQMVTDVYPNLRRPDGTKYTAAILHSVRGCLTANKMYEKVGNNEWRLNEEKYRIYEEVFMSRIGNLKAKRVQRKLEYKNRPRGPRNKEAKEARKKEGRAKESRSKEGRSKEGRPKKRRARQSKIMENSIKETDMKENGVKENHVGESHMKDSYIRESQVSESYEMPQQDKIKKNIMPLIQASHNNYDKGADSDEEHLALATQREFIKYIKVEVDNLKGNIDRILNPNPKHKKNVDEYELFKEELSRLVYKKIKLNHPNSLILKDEPPRYPVKIPVTKK